MAVDSDTAVLPVRPVDGLPPEGTYGLRLDRCVVEVSARLLGRPLTRTRLPASGGRLVVGEPTTLDLELRGGAVTVTLAPELGTFEGVARLRGEEQPLVLRFRSVHADDDTAVFAASGALSGRWHVELAAEFTR